jgi:hypothetical protein
MRVCNQVKKKKKKLVSAEGGERRGGRVSAYPTHPQRGAAPKTITRIGCLPSAAAEPARGVLAVDEPVLRPRLLRGGEPGPRAWGRKVQCSEREVCRTACHSVGRGY